MIVGVVGSGAVGGYYGARLVQAGAEVRFLYRSELEVVRRNGLRIDSVDGNWHGMVQAFGSAREMGRCDVVLVCLKSAQTAQFAELIQPVLGPETLVVCLMNGLGHEERIAQISGPGAVAAGAAFICAERGQPGTVRHFAAGGLSVGAYFPEDRGDVLARCRNLSSMFSRSGVPCRVEDDGRAVKWGKLVWNVPFSGLSIWAGGITTDRILADEALRSFAADLMDEVFVAAEACGIQLDRRAKERNFNMTAGMGAYRPSILVDYLEGRPLEWEAIVAEPLRRGLEAGASLPAMTRLLAGIRERISDR